MNLSRYFRTKNRLYVAIDNRDRIDGLQDCLDMHFAYMAFDLDGEAARAALNGEWFEPPYWALEGAIDYGIDGTREYDPDDLLCEYVPGYFEPLEYGDTIVRDGARWEYLTSIALSQEEEHQTEDGGFVYEYRGASFLRVWLRIGQE